ncbi:ergothioneine biosynthesis protein EgtB [Novosphingobium sp. H3SJ31-1]|uniref:Ergothioneine biosynthesis protein EgtB n=1 Tax=Novosphingobium album (ex Liu et al. 2023) TaxID=3031130 RepID=A0ABT5WRD3_9SPHN|nr:ergothioneine biosynthesis protein EgtB [Novosphingobium album (ex Liu et al. 2023)]MDE8652591.1 ergothioneine biosynthesis protein EgtB [Novosphingobium album (ex Liu et al. 2023)]
MTEALAAPLSDADATIQSMPDASPAKWHLAHTTWFFETFLLRDHLDGYRLHDAAWPFLFNSYYEAEGPRHTRASRGLLSRPTLDEVRDYRARVDAAMDALLDRPELAPLIELGLAHEQQHQELLLTDMKHAFAHNPLGPVYAPGPPGNGAGPRAAGWRDHPGGIVEIGHRGPGFAFDNEGPRHRVLIEPFALADRLVTNREWAQFAEEGGYRAATLWLSDGWTWVQQECRKAPLYWRDGEEFTLGGWRERDPDAPVAHISYYEADAFATWAGARLPTEHEWETMAANEDSSAGNQLDGAGAAHPSGSAGLFGDCWQWTRSAYLPYPRFRPADGAVGEYNGKFMSGQFVLKGASCATPRGHARASYRNFFYPHQRWQFTGLRLAKDL